MATNRHRACDDDEPVNLTTGSAAPASGPRSAYPRAILWVPDPTTRSGWNEWSVDAPEKPPRRLGLGA